MIYCQESDYFMYDPIVYTCFYVKRWRTVWFGAIKVNKLLLLLLIIIKLHLIKLLYTVLSDGYVLLSIHALHSI